MKHNCIGIIIALIMMAGQADAQSLESLLQRSVEANPELKALQLRYQAALQKSSQVNQLPAPEFGIGVPVLRPETRLGAQVLMVSARQMFPWFGTLNSNSDIAISMAAEEFERITATRLDLYYQVKEAYYKLYLLEEEQKSLQESIELLETLEQISIVKLETGSISAADVLMIQIELDVLKKNVQLKENMKLVYYSRINKITNNTINGRITVTDSFKEAATIDFNFEELSDKLRENHPMLRRIEAQIRTSEFKQKQNIKSSSPTFGIGIDYSLLHARTDADPEFNGRDVLIPKLMFSVPVYGKKYKSVNEEEILNQQLYNFQKDDMVNTLLSALVSLKSGYDNSMVRIAIVEEQIQKTESAYEILLEEYSNNSTRVDELIEIMDRLVEYELELKKAIVDTHLSKAGVERLTDF